MIRTVVLSLALALAIGLGGSAAHAQFMIGMLGCQTSVLTPTRVQGTVGATIDSTGETISQAFTNPVASGDTVVGGVSYDITTGEVLESVTDNEGNSYHVVQTVSDTDDEQGFSLFFLAGITNGPITLTFTFSVSTPGVHIIQDELENVLALDKSAAQFQAGPGTGANAVTSGSVTTTTAGELVYGLTDNSNASGPTFSAGTGFTLLQQGGESGAQTLASEDLVQASAGATAGTFTTNVNGEFMTGVMTFTPAIGTSCSQSGGGGGGAAFYISTSGNDSSGTGTLTSPWATLAKCQVEMELQPSTGTKTCVLRGGTYSLSSTLTLTSADNGETWQYYGADGYDSAVLNGGATGNNGTQWGIVINGGSNITINGLTIENFNNGGIVVRGGASFESQFPATGTANGNTVENNIVENIFSSNASNGNGGGIYIQGQSTNVSILNNVVHDTTGMAVRAGADSDGNTPNDTISGLTYKNNVIYNSCTVQTDCGALYVQDVTLASTNITIENNFTRDWQVGGKDIYLDDGASNVTISGNIIGPPTTSTAESGWAPIFIHGGNNITVSGNIFDLGTTTDPYIVSMGGTDIGGATQQANVSIKSNIIVGNFSGTGGGYNNVQGSAGGGDTIENPSVGPNDYTQYSSGTISTSGSGPQGNFSDSNPQRYTTTQLQCSTHLYTLAAGSSAFGSPINFPAIVGGWGPPGYSIGISTTAPSSCGNT